MRLNERKRVAKLPSRGDLCNVPCFKEALVARIRSEIPSDESLDEARTLFAALADRTRLRILHALMRADELCVCDVAHVLGMTVALTSHHLRKLRKDGVLRLRNDGRMAYYALADVRAAELVRRATRPRAA
jgi:DNA-binding transcriptional ArsR family regulator